MVSDWRLSFDVRYDPTTHWSYQFCFVGLWGWSVPFGWKLCERLHMEGRGSMVLILSMIIQGGWNCTDGGDDSSGEEEWLAETPVGLRWKITGDGDAAVGCPHYIQQQFIQFLLCSTTIDSLATSLKKSSSLSITHRWCGQEIDLRRVLIDIELLN